MANPPRHYVLAVCSEGPGPHYFVIARDTWEIVGVCKTYTDARKEQDRRNKGWRG